MQPGLCVVPKLRPDLKVSDDERVDRTACSCTIKLLSVRATRRYEQILRARLPNSNWETTTFRAPQLTRRTPISEIRVENLDMPKDSRMGIVTDVAPSQPVPDQLFSKPSLFSDFGFGESAWVFAPAEHFTPSRIEPNRSFASAFETVVVRKFKAPVESQPPGSVRLSLFTVFSVKCGTLVASPATSQQPVRAGTVCAEAFTVSHETNA